jgi:hypothetical protein
MMDCVCRGRHGGRWIAAPGGYLIVNGDDEITGDVPAVRTGETVPSKYLWVDDGEYVFARARRVEMPTYDIPENPVIRISKVFDKKVFYRCVECDRRTLADYLWYLRGMKLKCAWGGSADYESRPRGYLEVGDDLDE